MSARVVVSVVASLVTLTWPAHASTSPAPAEVDVIFKAIARELPPCPADGARDSALTGRSWYRECLDDDGELRVESSQPAPARPETKPASVVQARQATPRRTPRAPAPLAVVSVVAPAVASTTVVQSVRNTPPAPRDPIRERLDSFRATPEELAEWAPMTAHEAVFRAEQLLPIPTAETACRDVSLGPSVAGCFAVAGLTPEIAGLRRLACLLDAVQRYKLASISCLQRRVDEWRATVMWPTSLLQTLKTATLGRVETLRESAEHLLDEWRLPESSAKLASIYVMPDRVTRANYERMWGTSSGPSLDAAEIVSWLSVTNRNAIQARTSAAFGIAGELPEHTWERIGREGTRLLSDSYRDPLAALRHTPQMLADRARVDTNSTRLEAQTLLTEQVLRDYRRARRQRERALGWALLRPLLDGAQRRRQTLPQRPERPS